MLRTFTLFYLSVSCWLLACAPSEQVVFRQQSEFQEVIVSESRGGVRTLRFGDGGAIQSRALLGEPGLLLVPYVRAAMMGLAFVQPPKRVLVVGVGGGSIPSALRHRFPNAVVDAVDIDPVVVDVARTWFGVVEDERLNLVVSDARTFVEQVVLGRRPAVQSRSGAVSTMDPVGAELDDWQGYYDLIFLDAFGESEIPSRLTTHQFLESVKAVLTNEGVVVANLWSGRSNPQYAAMVETYQAVFEQLWVFAVPKRGNRIVVAPATVVDKAVVAERATAVDQLMNGQLEPERLLKTARLITAPSGAAEVLVD